MSKILGNLYIFSKLTTTLVLFSLVVFMGYIFYKSYKSQNITKTDETFNQNIDLVFESIENNKQNLKLLTDKAQSTEIVLNKLSKSIEANKTNINQDEINNLIEENNILKEEISNLNKKISSIKNSLTANIPNNELSEIIEIINYKFENGSPVLEDILILQKFNQSNTNEFIIEKLILLSKNNFIGLEMLNNKFDNSVHNYLNNKYLEENKNAFVRFLSEYIKIKPNNIKNFEDPILETLSQAKIYNQNKNIKESYLKISSLPDRDLFFENWIKQAKIYIEFKKNLYLMEQNA
tara:strand:+ start:772 stop:1650 length:879 start_codon:yes stop_codon:yes gene_type:complete